MSKVTDVEVSACSECFLFTSMAFFHSIFISTVGLPAYLSYLSSMKFRRSTFMQVSTSFLLSFVGTLSSLLTSHKGLLFFKMVFYVYVCAVLCVYRHGTSCFNSKPRRLCSVKLICYSRGLQQNDRRKQESNLCPSAIPGSQVQLSTPRLKRLTNEMLIHGSKSNPSFLVIIQFEKEFLQGSVALATLRSAKMLIQVSKSNRINSCIVQFVRVLQPQPTQLLQSNSGQDNSFQKKR